jgi:DNA modification methylase
LAPHVNSFELGQHGRYRTNIWQYRGLNSMAAGRVDELALHPTVKPVGMIADAIKDVSDRGGIVLDLFGGSGSTLTAAHRTGRRAYLAELDPIYCDRIIRRYEILAKDDAMLERHINPAPSVLADDQGTALGPNATSTAAMREAAS